MAKQTIQIAPIILLPFNSFFRYLSIAMKKFYVSIPQRFWETDWRGIKDAQQLVKVVTGAKNAVFICNSLAGLDGQGDGDLYGIELHENDSLEFFIMKWNFHIVNTNIAEAYVQRRISFDPNGNSSFHLRVFTGLTS